MPDLLFTQSDYLSWLFLQLAKTWCQQLFDFNSKFRSTQKPMLTPAYPLNFWIEGTWALSPFFQETISFKFKYKKVDTNSSYSKRRTGRKRTLSTIYPFDFLVIHLFMTKSPSKQFTHKCQTLKDYGTVHIISIYIRTVAKSCFSYDTHHSTLTRKFPVHQSNSFP